MRRLDKVGVFANLLGASVVFGFLALAPSAIDQSDFERLLAISGAVFVPYMVISIPLGRFWADRQFGIRSAAWLLEDRSPTESERLDTLRYPLKYTGVPAVFWSVAALIFGALWMTDSAGAGVGVFAQILLGGVSACALQYLLVERAMRPVTARALAGGPPPRFRAPGVATRLTMAWTLATVVPLLGIVGLAVQQLSGADLDEDRLIVATLFLVGMAIGVGLMAMRLAARSVADPVRAVESALERIQTGDLATRVEVNDGSEVGRLQAGFNRMAAGLEERERLRDLFGRHVGREVAQAALEREIQLGGEVREVAALFVDLVGSTTIAARRPPTEVVALLNEFFRIVVEAAERNGGWVNKFEGDAALCVFGAPGDSEDPAGGALCAAREIRDRVASELPDLDLGVGVSAGRAVAGNVGAEERYEYTVIGDPVNEAARLCELAKERPERLLASEAALQRASAAEASQWALGESVTLRGLDQPTRLATSPS